MTKATIDDRKSRFVLFWVVALFLGAGLAACSSAPTSGASANSQGGDGELDLSPSSGTKPIDDGKSSTSVRRETPSALYVNLSEAYKNQNDEGIMRAATQILSQNPGDAKALNAMGLAHYRKGRFLAARYFFSRANQAQPNSSEIANNLGLVSLALSEPHEAMRFFRRSLELNPSQGIAAANLGSIYVQEGDYTKAQPALETAVKKGMREPRTLTNYGIALTANGKYDQAKSAYEEALKLNSNSQEALFNYAILLIDHLKQNNEGLDQLNRLRFLGPVPDIRNKMNALENRAKAGIK